MWDEPTQPQETIDDDQQEEEDVQIINSTSEEEEEEEEEVRPEINIRHFHPSAFPSIFFKVSIMTFNYRLIRISHSLRNRKILAHSKKGGKTQILLLLSLKLVPDHYKSHLKPAY